MEDIRKSVLEMARGAIMERVDHEVEKVLDNILDVNTEPEKARKITLVLEFKPNDSRDIIRLTAAATSKLAPTYGVGTTLAVGSDENGEMMIAEIVPQVPGQISMSGEVQEQPRLLKIAGRA